VLAAVVCGCRGSFAQQGVGIVPFGIPLQFEAADQSSKSSESAEAMVVGPLSRAFKNSEPHEAGNRAMRSYRLHAALGTVDLGWKLTEPDGVQTCIRSIFFPLTLVSSQIRSGFYLDTGE
jgi:hypothetical protein